MEATTINELSELIVVSAHVLVWFLGFVAGHIR